MPKWTPYRFAVERAWDDVARLRPEAVASVLVVGDIHGEIKHLTAALAQTVELQVDAVVQVGDFWLADDRWHDHDPEEASFMWAAHGAPLPVVVVDGNHEAWPALRRFAATQEAQEAFASRRPVNLGGNVWWAWRDNVWRWGQARCGALGGAVSPDREDRDVRRFRWADETTTADDLELLIANTHTEHDGQLDVLFTHDSPAQVRGLVSNIKWAPIDAQAACEEGRRLLADAVNRTQPQIVIHGHWHRANREHVSQRTESVGLANDGRPDHTALLTLSDPPRAEYL